MKMTEKQIIEFEKKNKNSYKKPKEWVDAEDIINGNFKKQLNLHGVVKSFYCFEESMNMQLKCDSVCDYCKAIKKKR